MTPREQADAMVADPAWNFAGNPVKAISRASVAAATACESGRGAQARFWTEVGLALVEAAQPNPAIRVGLVLANLADRYGLR